MPLKYDGIRLWQSRSTFQICLAIAVVTLRLALANDGDAIRFPPLPKDKPYKLQTSAENSNSNGLVAISNGIANILRDQPPYDVINELLSKRSINKKKVLDYEAPIIALAVISLIFAVAIPIIGLIVCCFRFAGKCGGSLKDNKYLDIRPTKKRKQYTLSLVFCSIFLIIGAVVILVSSSNMTESLPKARTTVNNIFDDIVIYKTNTFKQMNHVVGPELLIVLVKILNEILVMGEEIVKPIIKEGGPIVMDLVSSIIKLDKAVTTSLNVLEEVQKTVPALVSDGTKLKKDLSESKKNISDARRDCNLQTSKAACDLIPKEELLRSEANFTQVPNITETKDKVLNVVKTNLTQEANKGNKSFHNLPEKVQNLAADFTSDFKNFSKETENIQRDFLRPQEDEVDKMLRETVLPYKDDINGYLGPDGEVTKYDQIRNVLYILAGTLVFLVVILTLVGISLGMIGASTFDTPSTRGDISDLGGRILIGAAVFAVFCAFFINILMGVVFLFGTNTSIVCRRVADLELLKHTIDDPEVMNGYPLTKILRFEDQSVKLTFTNIINECEKNKAPWTVLKLDYLFNLTTILHFRDTDKNIVHIPLSRFAENITRAANSTTGDVKSKLQATADSLINIEKDTVQPAQQKSKKLKMLVDKLQTEAANIKNGVHTIGIHMDRIERFIVKDAIRIADQGVKRLVHNILLDVDLLLKHVISQVHCNVGRCKPIRNMYHSITSVVCFDYFGNLNASWIGFGICAIFTLLITILTVRAAKHFRRFHRADNFRDSGAADTDLIELETAL